MLRFIWDTLEDLRQDRQQETCREIPGSIVRGNLGVNVTEKSVETEAMHRIHRAWGKGQCRRHSLGNASYSGEISGLGHSESDGYFESKTSTISFTTQSTPHPYVRSTIHSTLCPSNHFRSRDGNWNVCDGNHCDRAAVRIFDAALGAVQTTTGGNCKGIPGVLSACRWGQEADAVGYTNDPAHFNEVRN